jgi:hypothetical protein
MVEMPVDEIVDVFAVRNGFVTTIRAMNVCFVMPRAIVVWRAFLRIGRRHLHAVIVNVVTVRVMQVAIVKIVDVTIVLHSGMAAVGAMHVGVRARMLPMCFRHCFVLSRCRQPPHGLSRPLYGPGLPFLS